ncbi:hypothetical protein Rsub_01493 [Raphidocelis subcapitata]|uniref:Regulatory protein RecX n=1 Tax=Raphidocelis subcapitata TaxID=307507 RepID=A0A2V0NN77_9CHLO|nr:hypothetical protein Rsub_01493 [Raphidocelis subcapitata]|eukprot:GBF88994.1 hypothetical protein Rsub_01493 [Raphidocelis subcapitata]
MLRARAAAAAALQQLRCRGGPSAVMRFSPLARRWAPLEAPCPRQRALPARYSAAAAAAAGRGRGGSGSRGADEAGDAAGARKAAAPHDGVDCGSASSSGSGSSGSNAAQQARLEEARALLRAAASSAAAEAARAAAAGESDYRKALARAMRLINYRERSARELLQRLGEDGYDPGVAARAVARMQELGLQDDERYAQMFARGRWRASVRAPSQIAWELKSKGVSEQHARAALEAVFGPGGRVQPDADGGSGDEGGEGEERQGQSAWAQLLEQARRRADMSRGEDIMKRRAKLARWLQYRGHNWDTVKRVMREASDRRSGAGAAGAARPRQQRRWTVEQLQTDAVRAALLAHAGFIEPLKHKAGQHLGRWAGRAHRQLRELEGPARSTYAQWRSAVIGALAATPFEVSPKLVDAGSLMVGAGALGLACGFVLHLILG